jgi:hypothetical protein
MSAGWRSMFPQDDVKEGLHAICFAGRGTDRVRGQGGL